MAPEKTTIEVKIPTYQMLNSRKRPGDSFDDVIGRMSDDLEAAEQRVDELEARLEEQPDVVDDAPDRDGADAQGEQREPVDGDRRDDVDQEPRDVATTALDRGAGEVLEERPADEPDVDRVVAVDAIIDELDLPGSGTTLEARRDAVRACWRYLREQGDARKADFIDDVYPDEQARYGSAGGWWNAVGKQGLREVAREHESVEAPGEGEHIWYFLE